MHAFQMIGHSWFGTVDVLFNQKTAVFELIRINLFTFRQL
jgi:hypothetical protein